MLDVETLQIEVENRFAGPTQRWNSIQAKMAFTTKARVDFYKMLAAMLDNNLPLSSGIAKIHDVIAPQGNPLAHMLRDWRNSMVSGRKFTEAIEKYVPKEELVLIGAGERSNNLGEGLRQAAFVLDTKSQMKSAVVGALAKPAFLLVLMMVILAGFSVWMAPTFQQTFPPEKFPPHVQTLFHVADFIRNYWHTSIGTIAAIVTAISWSMGNWAAESRNRFEKVPPWSLYRTYNSASFMIALSSLLRAGVPLTEAIRSIMAMSSPWMKRHLKACLTRIENGDSYADVFNTDMLDEDTRNLVAIYADLTEFDKAIDGIGKESITNATTSIQKKSATANIFALMVVAGIIGWIYSSVMSINQLTKDITSEAQQSSGR